ncbi:hypothetical protein JW933_03060, partial [candidate division FCPU426 bacterium]|nr:hypothetical protein [candidate division FCPU426 bacterium]
MQKYVDRLQALLEKPELTLAEVKEGIISAYVIIARVNQASGNADAGLRQDADGLYSHINGFMGAIFWERGYDYDDPTIEQLAETKIMMDGMTQIYAMPEKIQSAFNDLYDYFTNRAKDMRAVLAPETKELIGLKASGAVTTPDHAREVAPASSDNQADEIEKILDEVPSEMDSAWGAPLPPYPGEETAQKEDPAGNIQGEPPSAEKFDPSRVLAEEPPSAEKFDPSRVLAEEPPSAEKFDPSRVLAEEPPSA